MNKREYGTKDKIEAQFKTHFFLNPLKWSEVKSLSCVQLFATTWTVAYQAP